MWRAFYYYFQIVGSKRTALVLGLLLLLLVNLYQLVPPLLVGMIAQVLAAPGQDSEHLAILALFFGGSFAFVSIARLQTKRFLEGIRIRNELAIRQESFRSLLHRPEFTGALDSGAYIQTLNQGLAAVFDFGNIIQNEGMRTIIFSVGLAVLLAYHAWPLALIVLGYVGLFYFLAGYFNSRLIDLERERLRIQTQTSATIVDTIEGNRTLKAYKVSQKVYSRAEKKNEVIVSIALRKRTLNFRLWQIFQCGNGVFFAGAIWQICKLASDGVFSITLTVTLIGYVQSFVSTFTDLLVVWSRWQESIVGLHQLESIYDPKKAHISSEVAQKVVNSWQTLKFENISFTYPGAPRMVLANRSFSFARGAHTQIKGPSGAGKSTLAKIVAGVLPPDSGSVYLDAVPISSNELARMVAFAMQEVQLFALTLKENITLCADVSQEKLRSVLRICRLEALVEKMPEGLDTAIGNGQWLLSGGELLRLSLARALLLDPAILILDETTSMIEESLEAAILEDLRSQFPHITLVLISHQTTPRSWIVREISL